VLALGELLIDMVAAETGDLVHARSFEKAAGGAPANVAVGVARLDRRAGFIGSIGDDPFGRFLRLTLEDEGVDTTGLITTPDAPTTLALVSRTEEGERDFQFYRSPGADTLLTAEAIADDLLRRARILHVATLSLTDEPARSATLDAVRRAREFGLTICCDPTLREPLWRGDLRRAHAEILGLIGKAHIVKVSQEELAFTAGTDDPVQGAATLWHDDLRLLVVSLGKDGCWFRCASGGGYVPGFAVHAVDATGAGDSFVAGMLSSLLDLGADLEALRAELVQVALRRANASGALATTKLGAIPALPQRAEVERLLGSGVE
jgi:fructokinase